MNEQEIAHMKYLLEILENVDTDMMIHMDDEIEMKYLKVDRESAKLNVVNYMKHLTKTVSTKIDVATIRDQV